METKNKIANDLYGADFVELTRGQKADVTLEFEDQEEGTYDEPVAADGYILCKIGKIGNGVEEKSMRPGETVQDLINKSSISFDSGKESITTQSGDSVRVDDEVEAEEVYMISPAIKSA